MTCYICGQIEGRPENDLLHSLSNEQSYQRRVLVETENFVVMPSLGPLGDGHVLLCPKVHFKSTHSVPVSYSGEYADVIVVAELMLKERYGSHVHHFEHGMAPDGRTVCTVDHAHLHLVAADAGIKDEITKAGNWSRIEKDPLYHEECPPWDEYLYYKSPDGERIMASNSGDSFPSQYIRRVFAEQSGDAESWNWRETPNIDKVNTLFGELQNGVLGTAG